MALTRYRVHYALPPGEWRVHNPYGYKIAIFRTFKEAVFFAQRYAIRKEVPYVD